MNDHAFTFVHQWWAALTLLAFFNLAMWCFLSRSLSSRIANGVLPAARYPHIFLSFLYTAGCAFRSVLPRADVQRICLYDSWLSSVAVGRSVATLAELCFVAQWALLTHEYAKELGSRPARMIALLIVPIIFVAECFSWLAVLKTWYLGNAIEESLWALTATLLVAAAFFLRERSRGALGSFFTVVIVCGLAYIGFMVFVDVPMYVTRFLADQAAGKEYLSLSAGWADATSRWRVTFAREEWATEIPWMTLYFSFAVWMSLLAPHAPSARAGSEEDQ
jgi:hypothetical protein